MTALVLDEVAHSPVSCRSRRNHQLNLIKSSFLGGAFNFAACDGTLTSATDEATNAPPSGGFEEG